MNEPTYPTHPLTRQALRPELEPRPAGDYVPAAHTDIRVTFEAARLALGGPTRPSLGLEIGPRDPASAAPEWNSGDLAAAMMRGGAGA